MFSMFGLSFIFSAFSSLWITPAHAVDANLMRATREYYSAVGCLDDLWVCEDSFKLLLAMNDNEVVMNGKTFTDFESYQAWATQTAAKGIPSLETATTEVQNTEN